MKIEFNSEKDKQIIFTILSKIVNDEELRFSEIQVIRNILFDMGKN